MANVGTAAAGQVLIGQGVTTSPTYASIGTQSGLTQFGVLVGQGSGAFQATPAGSLGQILQSQGPASNPAYTTATYPGTATGTGTILRADGTNWVPTLATYPNTTTINQLVFSSSNNTLQGLATINQASLTTTLTGLPTWVSLATNGQLIIGSTAGSPAAATLTAGAGISITNGSNSITIAATGAGFTWSETSGNFNAVKENGYFITTTANATLPGSPTEGDVIRFMVDTTNLLTITANTGQKIRLGTTISAAAGTAVNTQRGDAIELVYMSTGTTWQGISAIGGWNIT